MSCNSCTTGYSVTDLALFATVALSGESILNAKAVDIILAPEELQFIKLQIDRMVKW